MSEKSIGTIAAINNNLVTARFEGNVRQNEVAHVISGEHRLKSEVIRIQGSTAELQVYEETRWLKVGDRVSFSGELLSADLGPGLLGQVYDGLQNPLPELAEEHGFFIPRGVAIPALDPERTWDFDPLIAVDEKVSAGHFLGWVPEGVFNPPRSSPGRTPSSPARPWWRWNRPSSPTACPIRRMSRPPAKWSGRCSTR